MWISTKVCRHWRVSCQILPVVSREVALPGHTSIMDAVGEGCVIELGSKFSSFTDLKNAIELYQQQNHVQLYISDSRKLQAMLTRTPKVAKEAPSELVYYNLTYSCIHGGRKFKSRGKGVRPNQQTFRQECCAIKNKLIDILNFKVIWRFHGVPVIWNTSHLSQRYGIQQESTFCVWLL